MNEFKMKLSKGIFDPSVVSDLSEAFGKAEKLIDRAIPRGAPGLEREKVARLILAEARSGETQPDLVARVAVGKALLERQSGPSKTSGNGDSKAPSERVQRQPRPRAGATGVPSAGPHSTPNYTHEDATPGTGALSSTQPGTMSPIVIAWPNLCAKHMQRDHVFAVSRCEADRKECAMKMSSALVEQTLSQFDAEAIPDNHPAVSQLKEMFGDHTYFLDTAGLHVVEPAEPIRNGACTGVVVRLASWRDPSRASLVPHDPETTDVVITLGPRR